MKGQVLESERMLTRRRRYSTAVLVGTDRGQTTSMYMIGVLGC